MRKPLMKIKYERYGLESVPKEMKRSGWHEYAVIQFSFSMNSGNFLIPAFAVIEGGLPWFTAVFSVMIGAMAAFYFVSYLSLPGAIYGIPSQFMFRKMLGSAFSSRISSPLRVITSLYWFSVQIIGGTFILLTALKSLAGVDIPYIPLAAILGSVISFMAILGYDAVKTVTLRLLPLLIVGQISMFYVLLKVINGIPPIQAESTTFVAGPFLFFMSLAFVQHIAGVSTSSDLTRYAKSPRHAFWGMFTGNMLGYLMTAILGAATAFHFKSLNPFVALGGAAPNTFIFLLITITGLIAMISINIGNAYNGGFSLLNAFPHLGRIRSALVFSLISIILSLFPLLLDKASSFISTLGSGVVPLSALIVTDYIAVQKFKSNDTIIRNTSDHDYQWNIPAFYIFITMTLIHFTIPTIYPSGIIVFIITSLLYLAVIAFNNTTLKQAQKKNQPF